MLSGGRSLPVIGLAHGSRHPAVAAVIDALMAAVGEREGIDSRSAYLDLIEPDLTSVAADLAAAGHRSAVVVPLLFTAAFHATVDVPQALEAAGSSSGLRLIQTDILGTGADVEALLRDSLHDVEPDRAVVVVAVGSSDPAANEAVLDLANRLGRGRSGPVRVGFGTTEPRIKTVLAEVGSTRPDGGVLLPLFLAPGLLLDPVVAAAAEQGWSVVAPIAERAASIVARRYQDRASSSSQLR